MLISHRPFYGYHKSEHLYLKIYMYNPAFIKRAANLLQNGAILGRVNQPHESHLPYILQFLIDYNLYGMSFLHAPKAMVFHRQNIDGKFNHYTHCIMYIYISKKNSNIIWFVMYFEQVTNHFWKMFPPIVFWIERLKN